MVTSSMTSSGSMHPLYDKKRFTYWASVPPHLSEVNFKCFKVDTAIKITVNGQPSTKAVALNSGRSRTVHLNHALSNQPSVICKRGADGVLPDPSRRRCNLYFDASADSNGWAPSSIYADVRVIY